MLPGIGVHVARNPRSPSPESLFMIPGIGVHDTLEWVFTMGWNQRSGSPEYTRAGKVARLVSRRWVDSILLAEEQG